MSADNGIYIAEFPEGFRVAYASAIDNITYYPEGSIERKAELKSYFGDSDVYTKNGAFDKAQAIYKEIKGEFDDHGIIEYGICILPDKFESFL